MRRVWPLLATAAVCAAADKFDPKRVTPVPADQPIPLSDFYRPPLMRSPTINKAGTHVAASTSFGDDKYMLTLLDLETKTPQLCPVPPDRDVQDVWWAGDKNVMFSIYALKRSWDVAALAVGEVGKIDRAYPIIQYSGAQMVCIPDANPLEPLIWYKGGNETPHDEGVAVVNARRNSGRFIDLYALNVTDTEQSNKRDWNREHTTYVYPVPPGGLTNRYICNPDDTLAFAITENDGVQALQHLEGREWKTCPVNLDEIEVVDAGNESGQLLVLGPRQPGKPRPLQFMDGVTGKLGDVLLQDSEYDFNGFLYRDRTSHKILGAYYVRNGPTVTWFDPTLLAVQKTLDAQFKGERVNILDYNQARTKVVIARYNDRHPMIFECIDFDKQTSTPLTNSRPWLDASRMQPMQMFKYKTKDGYKFDAYLTLPKGASPQKPVPLVVIPHDGGPNGPLPRDEWGFDPEAQFLASRGYAVLRPNYRGSVGYNWQYPQSEEWDYAKMSEDIAKATNAVLSTKLIDRNRIAIMGTGFGAYLATATIANDPTLFRCAVVIDGIYDWDRWISEKKFGAADNPAYGWVLRRFGRPGERAGVYDAISPLQHADQLKAPMFIVYSKATSGVDIGQSNALASALERNHVAAERVNLGDEQHGLGYLDKKLDVYERIESFLGQHLK